MLTRRDLLAPRKTSRPSKSGPATVELTLNGARAMRDKQFVIVASRFNKAMSQALVEGATQALVQYGVLREHIETVWVPGAFELPVAAQSVAEALQPHAIIALGCVIKGDTPQYAAIGHAVAEGLAQASVSTKIPITFGVIVADSVRQAQARSGVGAGNRGREAAYAALAMVDLFDRLSRRRRLVAMSRTR